MTGGSTTEMVADYMALRTGVGAHWVARDMVRVSGPDTVSYLQGQLSQDVAGLGVGSTAESLILSPQGKIDAQVRVIRTGNDEVLLDTDGGWGETVAARLVRFRMRVKVEVSPLAWRCLALRGPGLAAAGEAAAGGDLTAAGEAAAGGDLVVPAGWPGLAGFDILGEEPVVPAGVRLCGDQAWEAVRVEAGVARMGSELTERTIPAETGLVEATVSFTKGCFTGQELVARIDSRGNRVPRHLRGVVVGADQVPPVGAEIRLGGPGTGGPGTGGRQDGVPGRGVPPGGIVETIAETKVMGSLTSVAWSPGLGAPVALAFVRREVDPPAQVTLSWGDVAVPARVEVLPLQVPVG